MTVLFAGAFLAGAVLVTITVPAVAALDSLLLLALLFTTLVGALGTGAFLATLPAPAVGAGAGAGGTAAFRVPLPRFDLALSTMLLKIPAAPVVFVGDVGFIGDAGLKGDTGHATCDFPSFVGRAAWAFG